MLGVTRISPGTLAVNTEVAPRHQCAQEVMSVATLVEEPEVVVGYIEVLDDMDSVNENSNLHKN